MELWNKNSERIFFEQMLKISSPQELFYYTVDKRYFAYWPKSYKGKKYTLQSRNSFIGTYTENWVKKLISPIAQRLDAYAVNNVICKEIGLNSQSPADVAICKTSGPIQKPEDILLILEVKMSIVWNWEYLKQEEKLQVIGDYTSHQGTPGLLRSDSMLKAIGKSLNIRISGEAAAHIPIIVIGNTPISKHYYRKVDNLKKMGIIQGFWSLNPAPLEQKETLKATPLEGFYRFDTYDELKDKLLKLLSIKQTFFAGMTDKNTLGKIIEIADKESTYSRKAEKFLELLNKIR